MPRSQGRPPRDSLAAQATRARPPGCCRLLLPLSRHELHGRLPRYRIRDTVWAAPVPLPGSSAHLRIDDPYLHPYSRHRPTDVITRKYGNRRRYPMCGLCGPCPVVSPTVQPARYTADGKDIRLRACGARSSPGLSHILLQQVPLQIHRAIMAAGRAAHKEPFASWASFLRRRAAACAGPAKSMRDLLRGRRHESWPLSSDVRAPHRARRLVHEQLARWQLPEQADTCELLVSELVTNALTHGCGPIRLSISLSYGKRTLQCAVADACPNLPRLRADQQDEEHGRGLRLVDDLSARWGSRRSVSGKTVWFALRTCAVRSPRRRTPGEEAGPIAAAWRTRNARLPPSP